MYNSNRQMGLTRPGVPQAQGRPAATPPPPNNAPRPMPPPRPAPPPRPPAQQPSPAQRPVAQSNALPRPAPGASGAYLPPAQRVVPQPQRAQAPAQLTGNVLPPAQPRVAQRSANAGGDAAPKTQYANFPAVYANIPNVQNANPPSNQYGRMRSVAAASANARPVNDARGGAQPAPPRPPRLGPSADQIMTEKRDDANPGGNKLRQFSALPNRATFQGQIVAQKHDGGLLLKPTGANASEKLVHLPKEAANQLRERAGSLLKRSMENGSQGAEVKVSHQRGQWSAAEIDAPVKKIG